MAGPSLHQTRIGMQLIDGTFPDIARQLKRIADALEERKEMFHVEQSDNEQDRGTVSPVLGEAALGGLVELDYEGDELVAVFNGDCGHTVSDVDSMGSAVTDEDLTVIQMLVCGFICSWPYDVSDPTIAANGKESWRLQVRAAARHLLTETHMLVDRIAEGLMEGHYDKGGIKTAKNAS